MKNRPLTTRQVLERRGIPLPRPVVRQKPRVGEMLSRMFPRRREFCSDGVFREVKQTRKNPTMSEKTYQQMFVKRRNWRLPIK